LRRKAVSPKKSPPGNKGPEAPITLSIRIQPRASKNEIVTRLNGGLKIRLTAPPVDGAANEALVKFLAGTLSIPRSQVEIVSGHTSREKIVRISGIKGAEVKRLLNEKGK
jgi:uncharacterized protein (TIGR00251 family)